MNMQLFNGEQEELVQFLCRNDWPYHTNRQLHEEAIRNAIAAGYYNDGRETFWMMLDERRVGIVIIDDIDDTIPLFDLRIAEGARGKQLGTKALHWLQHYLFGERQKIRIEGYTRADNVAMRKCFTNAGFVKEGYLRNAWENGDGTISDTVLYSVIYDDWRDNKTTPIQLDELPF